MEYERLWNASAPDIVRRLDPARARRWEILLNQVLPTSVTHVLNNGDLEIQFLDNDRSALAVVEEWMQLLFARPGGGAGQWAANSTMARSEMSVKDRALRVEGRYGEMFLYPLMTKRLNGRTFITVQLMKRPP